MDIVKSLKNARRAVAGFSIATLVASFLAIGVAQAQTFPDVNPDDWFSNYVENLVTLGVVNGDNPTYRPADNVNRAEMAKLVVEAFDLTLENPAEPTFDDVAEGAWYYSYVETAVKYGVVGGYTDEEGNMTGYYGPADFLTREQAAKMIVLGKPLTENSSCEGFPDVSGWSVPYVDTLYAYSIVDGYADGTFGPGLNINRAEIAKIVSNAMSADASILRPCAGFSVTSAMALSETTAEVCFSQAYDETSAMMMENYMIEDADAVELAVSNVESSSDPMCVVLTTDTQGQGTNYDVTVSDVTSADAMDLVGDMTSFVGYVPGSTAEGDLTVTLSADTTVGATLPSGATSVQMATWDFTAGSEDAMLKSLSVHRFGVSAIPSDLQVYLYEGNDRLTNGKSVNSSTNLAVFNNINLDIPAGDTRSLTLRLDVGDNSAGSTGELGFEIADADAVNADMGFVFGDFPVQGDLFGLSTTPAGTITIQQNGTITNPKVGEDNVTIAKFKLTAATEKAQLEQLGLLLTGTVSASDVENFALYVSGQTDPLAEVAMANSNDIVMFDISPVYEINKGDTRSFEVKADFNTGRSGDSVKVYLDESTDLVAIGDTYGYGMTVTYISTQTPAGSYDGTGCTTSAGDCSYSTLEGGDITISSSGPSATDIAVSGDDIPLLNFSITSVSDVTFRNFPIGLIATEPGAEDTGGLLTAASTSSYTDIKIVNVDTDEVLLGPVDSSSFTVGNFSTAMVVANDSSQSYYLFSDEIPMNAGDELNLAITADVSNTTNLAGSTVIASIATAAASSSYPEIRDINNKTLTNSSSLVPNSTITGKTMTVASPSLTVSLASVPATGFTSYVKGKKNVPFTGVVLQCGAASSCDITDVTLDGYFDEQANATWSTTGTDNSVSLNSIVGSVWLVDADENVIAAAKSVQSDGSVSFTNVDWMLDAGETAIFYVTGDVSVDAFKNSTGEYVTFGVAASGISYNDADNNSRSSTGTANSSYTTYVSVVDGGSLTIAVDPSTPKEDIVVAGTAGATVSKFRLTSTSEAFTVKKLSINAYQTAVTEAALGDLDVNVQGITLEYVNEAGDTVTKNGFLADGTALFTGLDIYVPKNDDAILTVKATMNTNNGGVTSGTVTELNLAFNNFEALAGDSGETYKADKLDATVSATADLDFGTITYTDPLAFQVDGAVAAPTLGSAFTFDADDNGADSAVALPVGTVVCFDATLTAAPDVTNTGTCSGENVAIITSYTDGATKDTYTAILVDDAIGAIADNVNLLYSLPGSGYLTATNNQYVYATKPTLTLAASSPSGTRSVKANDDFFHFDVTANAAERLSVRAATNFDGESDLDLEVAGEDGEATVSTTQYVSSASSARINLNGTADGDCWYKDMGVDLSVYNRASGWYYVTDAVGTGDTFDGTKMFLSTDTTVPAGAAGGALALSTGNLTEAAWVYFDGAITPVAGDTALGFCFNGAAPGGTDAGDHLYLDEFNVYVDKVRVNLASDASMAAGGHAQAATLKGGVVDVTGYINESTTSAATIDFFPTSDLETAKADTTNYIVETNTSTLITDQAGTADQLTASISYGTALTAGDFWWYDTHAQSKWSGYNSTSALNGNTLSY